MQDPTENHMCDVGPLFKNRFYCSSARLATWDRNAKETPKNVCVGGYYPTSYAGYRNVTK